MEPAEIADDNDCSICYERLASRPELARPAACRHWLCRPCLERLCRSKPDDVRCPQDRQQFVRYRIWRREAAGEEPVVYDVRTCAPVRPMVAYGMESLLYGSALLLALSVAPSWTLALHALAVLAGFVYLERFSGCQFYVAYAATFYGLVVPVLHFGPLAVLYAWLSAALLVRWIPQLPELRSNDFTPEKLLFCCTGLLLLVIYPAVLLSPYALLQVYLYTLNLLLCLGLVSFYLQNDSENQFTKYSIVFFSILHAPYLCQLSELSLAHLGCISLALLYLIFWITPRDSAVRAHFPEPQKVAIFACRLVLHSLLGYSIWIALFVDFCLAQGFFLIGFMSTERGAVMARRVPLMLFVYILLSTVLLPWKLFGFLSLVSYFCISVFITALADYGLKLLPDPVYRLFFYFTVMLILVPAVLP